MSSTFRIDNKELLRALGLAQAVKTHETFTESDHPSIMQDSYLISETDRKESHSTNSTIFSQRSGDFDRGEFLFAVDIDISSDKKDRIEVFTKDQPYKLARAFCKKHGIPKNVAELISGKIIDQAKAAVAKGKEYAKRGENEDFSLGESQVFPKEGDEPVSEEVNSPTLACSKTTIMTDRDFNSQMETKKGFSYVLESRTDEAFCGNSSSRIGSRDNLIITKSMKSLNDENASPRFEQEKRESRSRFYEKATRDIENKLKREAHYADIYNQERYKECSFHPVLNENSIKLASKYRGNVNIEHLLILKGKINEERRTVLKHNIRGQQSELYTFHPEINDKSKELDQMKRPFYDQIQRFEDLYQEYRILHEKKVQLKSRVQEEEEKNEVNLPFRPQILRGPENERNPEGLEIGDYLYSISQQLQVKRQELQKAYEKELKERAPKCSEKSEKIVKCMIESSLKMIFEKLDADKDGLVGLEDVRIKGLGQKLKEFLKPWREEMKESKEKYSFEMFCKTSLKTLKGMDAGMKSYLIFEVPKEFESEGKSPNEEDLWNFNLTFQPQIDENSMKIFKQVEGRNARKAHVRLYAERTKSEIRLKALENKVREEELKECSFHPKINKDWDGDTEAFYKKALLGVGDAVENLV